MPVFPSVTAPLTAAGLGDITEDYKRILFGTRCDASGALATGTTTSKIKTVAQIDYSIAGVRYIKAATDDLFVFTTLTVQAAGTTTYNMLCLDASGAATIVNGTPGAGYPAVPATVCPIGITKIVTDATHTFTPATTLLGATGITATHFNISVVPATLL